MRMGCMAGEGGGGEGRILPVESDPQAWKGPSKRKTRQDPGSLGSNPTCPATFLRDASQPLTPPDLFPSWRSSLGRLSVLCSDGSAPSCASAPPLG